VEAVGVWAKHVASGGSEAGASGWVANNFKHVDSSDSYWNGTTDALHTADCLSHRFTASLVVNTETRERCEYY